MDKPVYFIYLAGPEVFLPEPVRAGEGKKALIEEMNRTHRWPFALAGLYPMDNEVPDFRPDRETGLRIYRANIRMMDRAHFIAANMVRFRGPGMDAGTAFEMGYMRGLGKPVYAYYEAEPFYGQAEEAGVYADRVSRFHGLDPDHPGRDVDGLSVEDFAMADNLMMVGALGDAETRVQPSFRKAVLRIAESLL